MGNKTIYTVGAVLMGIWYGLVTWNLTRTTIATIFWGGIGLLGTLLTISGAADKEDEKDG